MEGMGPAALTRDHPLEGWQPMVPSAETISPRIIQWSGPLVETHWLLMKSWSCVCAGAKRRVPASISRHSESRLNHPTAIALAECRVALDMRPSGTRKLLGMSCMLRYACQASRPKLDVFQG